MSRTDNRHVDRAGPSDRPDKTEPGDPWADELIRRKGLALKTSLHTLFDNGATIEWAAERTGVSVAEAEAEYNAWHALVFATRPVSWYYHPGDDDDDF